MKQPARLEFWGDEIDTMHSFDLATQRRDEPIEKIYVSPAREVLFAQPAEAAALIRSCIKKARGKRRTALEACRSGPAGRRRDAGGHGQVSDAALSRARHTA